MFNEKLILSRVEYDTYERCFGKCLERDKLICIYTKCDV